MADNPASGSAGLIDAACSAQPIHIPGSIQPYGLLLAVDPARDFAVVAASANAGPGAVGRSLPDMLGVGFETALAERAAAGALSPQAPWETRLEPGPAAPFDLAPLDVRCHAHDGLVLIELEPVQPGDADDALLATRRLQHAIAELRAEQGGLTPLAHSAVRSIRLLTGYERVLVYRFDPDWNGQAIAEDAVSGWPQRLVGLHFPASDIPAQARELYRRALMRWVLSRDAEPVPLLAAPGWTAPIDLSHARVRSLSPIHLQYHRNLGVDGSMSLSIMAGEQLWGLVVCHHRRPHRTSSLQRAAAGALTDAFALRINPVERAGAEAQRQREQRLVARLIAQMAQIDDLALALSTGEVTLRDLFGASGAAIVLGGRATLLGHGPLAADVVQLAAWLRHGAPAGETFATQSLPGLYPAWRPYVAQASGLLAVFLTEDREDMLLWFRQEEPTRVGWGGKPDKDSAAGLLPRLSFERWEEVRHATARSWLHWEIEIAALLRHAISEVIVRNLRRVAALNDQLRQAQKMEAVGQLTGGLAHDFNNLLGGIMGNLELARTRIAQGRTGDLDRYMVAAMGAAQRAASLTHRLLAFSRRQTLDPQPTDVNRLIASMEELVRRTLGPAIRLDVVAPAGLWTTLCDGNQLENAVLNLTLNARDAMPEGGCLTVAAGNAELGDASAAEAGIAPGQYVALSVGDTGGGMSAETIGRAFEPFFTTKPLGEGTGLGLSMVYGFAKQSGGHVRIDSELGRGTTIWLYLPRHLGAVEAERAAPAAPEQAAPGAATLLLVDDEPVLRALVAEVLRDQGYEVLEAADGPDAMRMLHSGQALDLLITDVGLPGGMNGCQVAEAARQVQPGLKVLFVTGYAEHAALGSGLLDPVTHVLTKPFETQALLAKVRVLVA